MQSEPPVALDLFLDGARELTADERKIVRALPRFAHPHEAILPVAIMGVSSLISYERAKAESLGLTAKGGLMERAERIVILCVGLLFDAGLYWLMWAMLVLVSITAVQRFVKIWRQAAVAPSTAERLDARRSRRASRRAAFADRRARLGSRRRDA
ncbi:MAG: hypothetical protein EBR63_00835 [Actinobacteria bacterium]|nr:hypothetical protein [Actinomycetota bacterium]